MAADSSMAHEFVRTALFDLFLHFRAAPVAPLGAPAMPLFAALACAPLRFLMQAGPLLIMPFHGQG